MRWKSHVRFGGRAGETHSMRVEQGAPVRPLHLLLDVVGHRLRRLRRRRLLPAHRGLEGRPQHARPPGARRLEHMAAWARRGTSLDGLICHSDAGAQPGFKRSSQHCLSGRA